MAAALRGVQSRIFVIGGQDSGGNVLTTVEEYLAQAVIPQATTHTALPAPRASFGIGSTLSSNQIYVIGGVDNTGADQTTVFEYTIATNGSTAGRRALRAEPGFSAPTSRWPAGPCRSIRRPE